MAEFPSLPLFTDAYIADTVHLSTIEHGAYLLLLMTCWRSKGCRMPNEDKYFCRVTRLRSDQWRKMKPTIMEFFDETETHVTQKRLLKELTHVRKVVEARKQAGLRGGRPKSLIDNNTPKANGYDLSKQNESKPKAPTPTPIPKEEKNTQKRNSSMKKDWTLPDEYLQWVKKKKICSDDAIILKEGENFKDYWLGNGGTKKDWFATWRNHCRKDWVKWVNGSSKSTFDLIGEKIESQEHV